MEIEMINSAEDDSIEFSITVTSSFMRHECEPYGDPRLCALITREQGFGIIEDAVLMAMHLKRKT